MNKSDLIAALSNATVQVGRGGGYRKGFSDALSHAKELAEQLDDVQTLPELPESNPILDREKHNKWVDELAFEIDFPPLKDFINGLKEPTDD